MFLLNMLDRYPVEDIGFFEFAKWFPYLGAVLTEFFYTIVTWIMKVLGLLADLMHIAFYVVAGVDFKTEQGISQYQIEVYGQKKNILDYFVLSETMQKAYLWLALAGLVLVVIFTIYKIIKQDYFEKAGPRSKGPIFRNVAISCISFLLVIPIFYLIIRTSSILAVITIDAMGLDAGQFAGAKIFSLTWSDGGNALAYVNNSLWAGSKTLNGGRLQIMQNLHDQTLFTMLADTKHLEFFPGICKALGSNDSPYLPEGGRLIVVDNSGNSLEPPTFYWYLYILGIIVALKTLYQLLLAMLQRIFKLMGLFVVAPSPISQYVLDDGSKFHSWLQMSIQEGLRLVVAVMSFAIWLIVLSMTGQIDFVAAFKTSMQSAGGNGSATILDGLINAFMRILLIMGASGAVTDLDAVLTPLITGAKDGSLASGSTGKATTAAANAIGNIAATGLGALTGSTFNNVKNAITHAGSVEQAAEEAEAKADEDSQPPETNTPGGGGNGGGDGGGNGGGSDDGENDDANAPQGSDIDGGEDDSDTPESSDADDGSASPENTDDAGGDDDTGAPGPEASADTDEAEPSDDSDKENAGQPQPQSGNQQAKSSNKGTGGKGNNKSSSKNAGSPASSNPATAKSQRSAKLRMRASGGPLANAGRGALHVGGGLLRGVGRAMLMTAKAAGEETLKYLELDKIAGTFTSTVKAENKRSQAVNDKRIAKKINSVQRQAYMERMENNMAYATANAESAASVVDGDIKGVSSAVDDENAAAVELNTASEEATAAGLEAQEATSIVKKASDPVLKAQKKELENQQRIAAGDMIVDDNGEKRVPTPKQRQDAAKEVAKLETQMAKRKQALSMVTDENHELSKLGLSGKTFDEIATNVKTNSKASTEVKEFFASKGNKKLFETQKAQTAREANKNAYEKMQTLENKQQAYDSAKKKTAEARDTLAKNMATFSNASSYASKLNDVVNDSSNPYVANRKKFSFKDGVPVKNAGYKAANKKNDKFKAGFKENVEGIQELRKEKYLKMKAIGEKEITKVEKDLNSAQQVIQAARTEADNKFHNDLRNDSKKELQLWNHKAVLDGAIKTQTVDLGNGKSREDLVGVDYQKLEKNICSNIPAEEQKEIRGKISQRQRQAQSSSAKARTLSREMDSMSKNGEFAETIGRCKNSDGKTYDLEKLDKVFERYQDEYDNNPNTPDSRKQKLSQAIGTYKDFRREVDKQFVGTDKNGIVQEMDTLSKRTVGEFTDRYKRDNGTYDTKRMEADLNSPAVVNDGGLKSKVNAYQQGIYGMNSASRQIGTSQEAIQALHMHNESIERRGDSLYKSFVANEQIIGKLNDVISSNDNANITEEIRSIIGAAVGSPGGRFDGESMKEIIAAALQAKDNKNGEQQSIVVQMENLASQRQANDAALNSVYSSAQRVVDGITGGSTNNNNVTNNNVVNNNIVNNGATAPSQQPFFTPSADGQPMSKEDAYNKLENEGRTHVESLSYQIQGMQRQLDAIERKIDEK